MIEYTYPKAYRFVGHEIQGGTLVPLEAPEIGARMRLYPLSEAVGEVLPPGTY